MQSSTVTILLGVCSQLLMLHECSPICSNDKYTVFANGSVVGCLPCEKCHPGLGLSPICGTVISPSQTIECKPCPPGTFSNTYDSAPCQNCHECVKHEIVAVNCTRYVDRNCSGTCVKGNYFSKKYPHSCQHCSYCCFDEKDEIQEECVKQGLNAMNRHCSHRVDKICGPKPMQVTSPVSEPAKPSSSSSSPKDGSQPRNYKNNILTIVFGALAGVLLTALSGTIFFKRRKGKLNTNTTVGRPSQTNSVNGVNIDQRTERPSPVNQVSSHAAHIPQEIPPVARLQALQNNGFVSHSSTPQASPRETPYHTEDELEELPDVRDARSKRLVKRQRSKGAANDDASDNLLDFKVEYSAGRKSSFHGESTEGAVCGHRRSSSGHTCFPWRQEKTFLDSLLIVEQPTNQKGKEGTKVEFRCQAKGKRKITYQWLKDGINIQGQTDSTLVLDPVKPDDFGFYSCEVRCPDGQNRSESKKSDLAELDVFPCKGMRFKYLTDAFRESPELQEDVEILLQKKVPGLGGWKQLAQKYDMKDTTIVDLEGRQDGGKGVIEYLKTRYDKLTVYNFCKTLKEDNMRRTDIIKELLVHLVSVKIS